MAFIDRIGADFARTFSGPAMYIGCEPKMERVDRNNRNSEEVQSRDKNGGGLKWTATVAVKVKSFNKEKSEILPITLTSPSVPCTNLHPGQLCMIEGLEMGTMKADRAGFPPQFWSAAAIRPVTMPAQPGQPAPAVQR